MTKINNYKNSINFKGLKMAELNNDSLDKTKKAAKFAINYLRDNIERMVPENGQFSKLSAGYKIEGTQNVAKIAIEHSPTSPKTQRLLTISALRNGSDEEFSYFMKEGTKKEIIDYINDDNKVKGLFDEILKLSDKVDKHFT